MRGNPCGNVSKLGRPRQGVVVRAWHLLTTEECHQRGIRFHGDPGTPTEHLGPNPSTATPPTDTVKR